MVDLTRPELPLSSAAISEPTRHDPDPKGHFGVYGGRYVAEALMAVIEATAFRSMHGTWTSPPIGSQVSPRLCSMPISAAFSTCAGVPPSTSARAPAAIEQADPTSPWQPTSAPEIDAFSLNSTPIAAAVSRNRVMPRGVAPGRGGGQPER